MFLTIFGKKNDHVNYVCECIVSKAIRKNLRGGGVVSENVRV